MSFASNAAEFFDHIGRLPGMLFLIGLPLAYFVSKEVQR